MGGWKDTGAKGHTGVLWLMVVGCSWDRGGLAMLVMAMVVAATAQFLVASTTQRLGARRRREDGAANM